MGPEQTVPGQMGRGQMGPSLRKRFSNSYVSCAVDCTVLSKSTD